MSLVPASQQQQQQQQIIKPQKQRVPYGGGECTIRHGNAFKVLQEMSTI